MGLDIGSTTLKCVVLNEEEQIVFKEYRRHKAQIKELALEYLHTLIERFGAEQEVCIGITGSAGLGVSEATGLPFIQEVVATQLAITAHNDSIDVAIELGGEDAKILFLSGGTEVRMNGSCAGGTGAFIDQMASLLNMTPQEMDKISLNAEHIYPVASRCGVFAKTDIQPLINQGAKDSDIAMSIYHAVANQTIGGLAQGRAIEGNILFLGGPLTFLAGLQKAFQDILNKPGNTFIFPNDGQYFVAYGAALFSNNNPPYRLEDLISKINNASEKSREDNSGRTPPLFSSQKEYEAFQQRHLSHAVQREPLEDHLEEVFLGIDAGSTTVKLVLIAANGSLLYEMYESNNGKPLEAIQKTLANLYTTYPSLVIRGSCVTGYGESLVAEAFNIDHGIVETIAHLTAAKHFMPNVDFIIDIGGQDMKCFKIKNGIIDTIFLNEACSSGCGSFVSAFANALGYNVSDFSKLGLFAQKPVDLGSRCTVFMNSSVKQAQKEGADIADISAGLSMSVVKNALYKVIRVNSAEDLGEHIVVQGGTFYNDAILRAFENELGKEVIRPDIAGLMGAYGCALYAAQHASTSSHMLNKDEILHFSYDTVAENCTLCGNHCPLTITRFSSGKELIAGNRCERPLHPETFDANVIPYNAYKEKRAWIKALQLTKKDIAKRTVGIPLALNMYELYPFWYTFWSSLDFHVVLGPFNSKKLYLSGQQTIPSDTVCYPAKLVHGQIEHLLKKKPDCIFYPCLTYNIDESASDNHYNCPVVAYYPQLLDANVESLQHVQYLFPFYGIHNPKHFKKAIVKDMKSWFPDIASKDVKKAVDEAYQAQNAYDQRIKAYGQKGIAYAKEHQLPIIVLAGRPYHVDPEINHGIDELIESFGAVVLTEDALPLDTSSTQTNVLNQWTYHARLYNAAKFVSKHPDMYLIQLVSFGCGLDAITTDEVCDILEQNGDIYTQIKIDEINNLGAVKIRLRSLFAAIEERKQLL